MLESIITPSTIKGGSKCKCNLAHSSLDAIYNTLAPKKGGDNPVNPGAPYLLNKKFPPVSLQSIDGKSIAQKDLPTNYNYICIIIFSTDCPECEYLASELQKKQDKFKNVLFIWDSYRDEMELIKKFAAKNSLTGKKNIIIGRDPDHTIPSFFRPMMTPFVALYKNNTFVNVWEEGVESEKLFEITKQIK
jgi:cytochrome oxidase Cu insertion factor (SCO1/SenC/PrrC family)